VQYCTHPKIIRNALIRAKVTKVRGISDEREQSCTYDRAAWGFDCKRGWRRGPGEPRCLINMARFCVLRARPRCGLPPSSRVKPAPAWSCLNAGIHHARNPALWCSADRSSGKACGRRGSGGNKGVGFDKHGGGGCGEGERESGRAHATAEYEELMVAIGPQTYPHIAWSNSIVSGWETAGHIAFPISPRFGRRYAVPLPTAQCYHPTLDGVDSLLIVEPVSVSSANSCRETVWRGQRPGRDFWRQLCIPRYRDLALSRLLRESRGKLKTIPRAPGNRAACQWANPSICR
jgi:hypothetical protein